MKKPVCVTCGVSFQVARNGVVLVEEYLDPPEPYKTWAGDLLECPGCGVRIVAQFADNPSNRAGDGYIEDHVLAAEQFGVVVQEHEHLGWVPTTLKFESVPAFDMVFIYAQLPCNPIMVKVGIIREPWGENPVLALDGRGFGFRGVRRILAEWEKERGK